MKKTKLLALVFVIIMAVLITNISYAEDEGGTETPAATPTTPTTGETEGAGEETGATETETLLNSNFESAKFDVVSSNGQAILKISGVDLKSKSWYGVITNNDSKPDIASISNADKISLGETESGSKIYSADISNKYELNKDLYLSIIENDNNVSKFGVKLSRFTEAKYNDAFNSSFVTYKDTQILTNFVHSASNARKLQIKIGKITDTEILNKIKSKDSSSFSGLLTYAKAQKGLFDKTLDAESDSSTLGYTDYSKGLDITVEDGAYYFLYVKALDEEGKYVSNEAVTVAQGSVPEKDKWFLLFYGENKFSWAKLGNSVTTKEENKNKVGNNVNTNNVLKTTDNSVAYKSIPKTGLTTVLISIVVISVLAGVLAIQNRKYKDIK